MAITTAEPIPAGTASFDLGSREFGVSSLVRGAFLQQFLSGEHRYFRELTANWDGENFEEFGKFLPRGAEVIRELHQTNSSGESTHHISVTVGDTCVYLNLTSGSFRAVVTGDDDHAVKDVLKTVSNALPAPPVRQPLNDSVPVRIWSRGPVGGRARRRRLDIYPWERIRPNYPNTVENQLEELTSLTAPPNAGRLILFHGQPGTGKTTAIKALFKAWEPWCEAHYLLDAETAFTDPEYLLDLLAPAMSSERGRVGQPSGKWKLVVAEDSDEFLRADARRAAGSSLGRLLNASDGILGQGAKTIFLLTTNENLKELHPALIRPGRTMAQIEFQSLSAPEANEWLGGIATVDRPVTLAELFEKRGEITRIHRKTERNSRVGFAA